jgi:hypothetical protein
MTEEKIKLASEYFVECLNEEAGGKSSERNLSVIGSNAYKPFYRSCVVLSSPYSNLQQTILDIDIPTVEEAIKILKLSHPWFEDALSHEDGCKHFEVLYEDIKEVWDDHLEDAIKERDEK